MHMDHKSRTIKLARLRLSNNVCISNFGYELSETFLNFMTSLTLYRTIYYHMYLSDGHLCMLQSQELFGQ